MKIMNATINDVVAIEDIYLSAKKFMQENNNFQWSENYPSIDLIKREILNKEFYKIVDDNEIVACFSLIKGPDKTYDFIKGEWINNESYYVIHRIAKKRNITGVLKLVVEYTLHICKNIRIDTKETNKTMKKKLAELGFIYCGIIYIENKEERLAYQLVR